MGLLSLVSIVLGKVIVIVSDCLESYLVNVESYISSLHALWEYAERIW